RRRGTHKPGSIGIPIPETTVKIVNDTGLEVPRNTIGEVIVQGDGVMKGYYKNDAATEQVIQDGWLCTGDLGRMDEDGFVFLTGRKKRLIITNGYNVYPKEVEMILELHPDVAQAKVISKPNLMRGEIVSAMVVRHPGAASTEKEIMKHCRTYLSSYKLPRELTFVKNLPD
ncbi:MAG: AMP-binding protein, partial [Syntrophobacterales bacterium]|nr:AMP-binding protein [Syntrophobacterales bacterium]